MIESCCRCVFCDSAVEVCQETFSIATNLHLTWCPKDKRFKPHTCCVKAERLDGKEHDPFTATPSEKNNDDCAGNCVSNSSVLVLAMQQLGLGMRSVLTFLGTLGMQASMGNTSQWKKIQDQVGVAEEAVKDKVLKENAAAAIEVAKENGETAGEDGTIGLACSIDGGWQKRSSGRTYDSPSGHNLLVDCRTKRVLDCVVYSKKCSICDRKKADVEAGCDDESGKP